MAKFKRLHKENSTKNLKQFDFSTYEQEEIVTPKGKKSHPDIEDLEIFKSLEK